MEIREPVAITKRKEKEHAFSMLFFFTQATKLPDLWRIKLWQLNCHHISTVITYSNNPFLWDL